MTSEVVEDVGEETLERKTTLEEQRLNFTLSITASDGLDWTGGEQP